MRPRDASDGALSFLRLKDACTLGHALQLQLLASACCVSTAVRSREGGSVSREGSSDRGSVATSVTSSMASLRPGSLETAAPALEAAALRRPGSFKGGPPPPPPSPPPAPPPGPSSPRWPSPRWSSPRRRECCRGPASERERSTQARPRRAQPPKVTEPTAKNIRRPSLLPSTLSREGGGGGGGGDGGGGGGGNSRNGRNGGGGARGGCCVGRGCKPRRQRWCGGGQRRVRRELAVVCDG